MDHKKILMELSKRDDLKNKVCADCTNPNPQWASLSFATFICLQCAGIHRGFGVHVSFVRSISMDTWQDEQVKRMQLGGNGPFREFMKSYTPAEQGGYSDILSPYDTYHCWAATQYREKLDAMLAGKDWLPSPPTEGTAANSSLTPERPASAQGLRKARATSRALTGSALRSSSGASSPASIRGTGNGIGSNAGTPDLSRSGSSDQKAENETYFASLGHLNANRPLDLPPSQGGRYTGFGSTPAPSVGSSNSSTSYGLSSRAAPTLQDLQENPLGALSKGWSLFSSAVVGASKTINESVIQPGMERVGDPEFQGNVKGMLGEAQKRAGQAASSANDWGRKQFGVDVGGKVGTLVGGVGGNPRTQGYGQIGTGYGEEETSGLYHDDDAEYWGRHDGWGSATSDPNSASVLPGPPSAASDAPVKPPAKNSEWDDEWKDF
ncbi:ArfGap-domain-containing protein [Lentinula aciculospora]|uniref:ArfGap-domain-containing protein n=1 Tax=Lentinula aciculospora TaxID=153920 RepID=A0A9W9ACY3_9AGAR|nr:ArfGap-domain-containing protein [Lentinula aciculospora]